VNLDLHRNLILPVWIQALIFADLINSRLKTMTKTETQLPAICGNTVAVWTGAAPGRDVLS